MCACRHGNKLGAKGSFFGDLKAHGREAYDFFTDRKVLISRW